MDIAQKIKEIKSEVQELDTAKQMKKSLIEELKKLVEDKKKKLVEIDKLKAEEDALLQELMS